MYTYTRALSITGLLRISKGHTLSKLQLRKASDHAITIQDLPTVLQPAKNLSVPVHEKDIEELYAALSAPAQSTAITGPGAAAAATKLDPDYLYRLKLNFEDSAQHDQRTLQKLKDNATNALQKRNPSLPEISQVIQLNALTNRPLQAQMAFDMIEQNNMTPDLIAVNHLMDAYARSDDLDKVISIFRSIKDRSLQPDVITYGIIINACIKRNQLSAAFKLYENIKANNINPSQPIFTSLIKGCLKANDPARAWKTFNYMRSEICPPDQVTFSLMIHACAKTQDAERALDLFQEMAERGLAATEVTFTSLIQACGSRKDYYHEAFELLGQMAAEGFTPNLYTYNVLLQAAAKQGDVVRARLVWNDLIERAEAEGEHSPLNPIAPTFISMFQTYAHAISIARRAKTTKVKEEAPEKTAADSSTAPAREEEKELEIAEQVESKEETGLVQVDVPEKKAPRLTSTETHPKALLQDANLLWQYLNTSGTFTPASSTTPTPLIPITQPVFDAYLSVLCANPTNTHIPQILDFYQTIPTKYALTPTGRSRSELLSAITRKKDAMASHGTRVWTEFLEWDKQKEEEMIAKAQESGNGLMTEEEKEVVRKEEGRGKIDMWYNFIKVVNGYTRIGDLPSALSTLHQAQTFRSYYYLPPIQFKNIWSLVTRARDLAEDGKLETAKKLLELCPAPAKSPLDEVRRRLKAKFVGGGWWGWEALGVDKSERLKLSRLQNRERMLKQRKVNKAERVARKGK